MTDTTRYFVVTLRMSAHDRALLAKLVNRASERAGGPVSVSAVVRQLVAREAQARGIEVGARDAPPRRRRRPKVTPECSEDVVRAALCKHTARQPGLAAELARRLRVQPAQISRFKAGTERFPSAKLDRLFALMHKLSEPSRADH
jgi:hypothetical protein